jgi:hypothetical protein
MWLTWRPGQGAAAKDVQVQVPNGLTTVLTVVDHKSVPAWDQSFISSNPGGCDQQFSGQFVLGTGEVRQPINVLPRYDQDMAGSLGVNVPERQKVLISENFRARNLPGDDFAEKTITHDGVSSSFQDGIMIKVQTNTLLPEREQDDS